MLPKPTGTPAPPAATGSNAKNGIEAAEENRKTPNLNTTNPTAKVEVKVAEDGIVTVGNYKLGKIKRVTCLLIRLFV